MQLFAPPPLIVDCCCDRWLRHPLPLFWNSESTEYSNLWRNGTEAQFVSKRLSKFVKTAKSSICIIYQNKTKFWPLQCIKTDKTDKCKIQIGQLAKIFDQSTNLTENVTTIHSRKDKYWVFANSTNITTNIETALLSTLGVNSILANILRTLHNILSPFFAKDEKKRRKNCSTVLTIWTISSNHVKSQGRKGCNQP